MWLPLSGQIVFGEREREAESQPIISQTEIWMRVSEDKLLFQEAPSPSICLFNCLFKFVKKEWVDLMCGSSVFMSLNSGTTWFALFQGTTKHTHIHKLKVTLCYKNTVKCSHCFFCCSKYFWSPLQSSPVNLTIMENGEAWAVSNPISYTIHHTTVPSTPSHSNHHHC